jgi:tryptophan halogenase
MNELVNDVLIVGGGTAGWLTAAVLAKRLGADKPNGVQITLIESTEIGTIGVGEGTVPTFRTIIRSLGVDEAEFMRECSASFKQAIKFVDWVHAPVNGTHTHFFHPFERPQQLDNTKDLAPYWALGIGGDDRSYSDVVTLQGGVIEALKAPKRITDRSFGGPLNYAYHLDAAKLAAYLRKISIGFGVRHLIGTVETVELTAAGDIAAVVTKEHGTLRAGLYVDCTGFAGVLIGRTLNEPWRDLTNMLFVDRAVAMQVPYPREDTPIVPATLATAREGGWIWDIGLDTRRGIGYCYSSKYSDDDRAEQVFRDYIGPAADGRTARRIKMRIGYRERQWVRNCVSVGLAAGFLEPLEATGINQIEAAVLLIAEYFPRHRSEMERVARHFSYIMAKRIALTADFLKLHYHLTKRTDYPFWLDNSKPETVSDALREKIGMWERRPPCLLDFETRYEAFDYVGYQYIVLGMGLRPNLSGNESAYPLVAEAETEFRKIREGARRALEALPDHRALLAEVYNSGFQPKGA